MTTENITEIAIERPSVKLTKVQREFFTNFSRNAVSNILAPVLAFKGVEITDEQVAEVVATIDLTTLTQAIADAFLERVDFKILQKVDKFMRSDEFMSVVAASSEVNAMVQSELVQVIAPLIPSDEPSDEALADLAS